MCFWDIFLLPWHMAMVTTDLWDVFPCSVNWLRGEWGVRILHKRLELVSQGHGHFAVWQDLQHICAHNKRTQRCHACVGLHHQGLEVPLSPSLEGALKPWDLHSHLSLHSGKNFRRPFFLCDTTGPDSDVLMCQKDNRENGKKKSHPGSQLWPKLPDNLEPVTSPSLRMFLSNMKGPRLFLLWRSVLCVSADNHHGSRVWWGKQVGGIGLPVSAGWVPVTLGTFWKEARGAQCTFLIIHRDWQTEALKLSEPFRKATIIRHWVRVSRLLNSRRRIWGLNANVACPRWGHRNGSEKSLGNRISEVFLPPVFRDRKDGSAEQIPAFWSTVWTKCVFLPFASFPTYKKSIQD